MKAKVLFIEELPYLAKSMQKSLSRQQEIEFHFVSSFVDLLDFIQFTTPEVIVANKGCFMLEEKENFAYLNFFGEVKKNYPAMKIVFFYEPLKYQLLKGSSKVDMVDFFFEETMSADEILKNIRSVLTPNKLPVYQRHKDAEE